MTFSTTANVSLLLKNRTRNPPIEADWPSPPKRNVRR